MDHAATIVGRLQGANQWDDGIGCLAGMDVRQAIGLDGGEELLGLSDFHCAVPEGHGAGQAGVVPVGHGGGDHAAGAGQFAVVIVVGRFLHWSSLIATAFKRAVATIDAIVQTVGALHTIRHGDFADGAAVGFKQRYGGMGGVPIRWLVDVIGLYFTKAHSHQPAQGIERMGAAAQQGGLGGGRVDAPMIGGAIVDDVMHVVEVFAFAIKKWPEVAGTQKASDVVQAFGVAHLIAHLVGQAVALAEGNDLLAFGNSKRHGNFAEYMFAGIERHDGVLAMQMVGGGDDHRIDGTIGEDGVDMVIDVGDMVVLSNALGEGVIAVAHGDNGTVRQHLEGLQV